MKYRAVEGIVSTTIFGKPVLIPSRRAMDRCNTIQVLSYRWAFTWNMLEQEKPLELILKMNRMFCREPDEVILEQIRAFEADLCKKGFLVELPEQEEQDG